MSDDAPRMTSHRPYLLRALYEWIADNGMTPHVLVDASQPGVQVPPHAVQDGRVVLNTILTELGHRADFVGTDTFMFTASDGFSTSWVTPARPDWVKGRFDARITQGSGTPATGSAEEDVSDKPRYLRKLPDLAGAEREAVQRRAQGYAGVIGERALGGNVGADGGIPDFADHLMRRGQHRLGLLPGLRREGSEGHVDQISTLVQRLLPGCVHPDGGGVPMGPIGARFASKRPTHHVGTERRADDAGALQVDEWPKRFREVPVL